MSCKSTKEIDFKKLSEGFTERLKKENELYDKRLEAYKMLFSKEGIIAGAIFTAMVHNKSAEENYPIKLIRKKKTKERLELEFKVKKDRFDIHLYKNEEENKYSFNIYFFEGEEYSYKIQNFFCFSEYAALIKIMQILNYAIKDDFNIKKREELEYIQKGLDEIENAFAELEIKLASIEGKKLKKEVLLK